VDPSKNSSTNFDCIDPAAAAVSADISSSHLEVVTPAAAADSATDNSSSSSGAEVLGSAGLVTLRVQGLAAGLYRLAVPALLLEPPEQAYVGSGWSSSNEEQVLNSLISIRVLPRTAAAAAAGEGSEAATEDTEAAAAAAAAAAAVELPPWLWASNISYLQGPAVLQPSPSKQLHIASLSCSATEGLSVQLAGTAEQLSSVQLLAVFSRFLPDGTITAAQLLQNTLPWGEPPLPWVSGFGFNQGLRDQASGFGICSGKERGLGFEAAPQLCGDYGKCGYSSAAKLDSAVAYVLQVGCNSWSCTIRGGFVLQLQYAGCFTGQLLAGNHKLQVRSTARE
jgi:hypothetical protein